MFHPNVNFNTGEFNAQVDFGMTSCDMSRTHGTAQQKCEVFGTGTNTEVENEGKVVNCSKCFRLYMPKGNEAQP